MKNIKSLFAVAVLSMTSTALTAQNLNTGYFNDGYLYRHETNPAAGNEQGYVSMPIIGNINANMNGNLGVDKVIFNVNGRTTTFLNGAINAESFLSNIKDENKINQNAKIQVFGVGFGGKESYNTIELNIRENMGVNIPGSLFQLAKEGLQNKTYEINDFNVHADAYTEIAYGHSHQINNKLRVGAKLKLLLGIANIDANLKKAQIDLGEDAYTATVDAEVQASMKGLHYEMGERYLGPDGDQTLHKYINGADIDKSGISGIGFGIDLGAEYHINDNFTASFALLDLGGISWNNNMLATTNGQNSFNTDKYLFSPDKESMHSFDNEIEYLTEDIASLYELQDGGDLGSHSTSLGATMNVGLQYTPYFYDKLSFGLMNSTRFGDYGWTEFRASANVSPVKSVSASVSLGVGTYGTSFGWLINLHPNGINLFLAMDRTFSKLAKPGIPVSGNGSVSVGVNFPFK